jgi:hypothetical protein
MGHTSPKLCRSLARKNSLSSNIVWAHLFYKHEFYRKWRFRFPGADSSSGARPDLGGPAASNRPPGPTASAPARAESHLEPDQ